MIAVVPRVPLAALAVCVFLPAAWAQEEERFTTGPPKAGGETRMRFTFDEIPSPPGGGDIKANPTTSAAQNETSLAVNPNDPLNWVGVANDYRFGTVQTGWYTTADGGQSWISGTFGIDPGFSFSGDPCVAFQPNGNPTIICMMYDGPGALDRVTSFTSNDKGQSWGTGVSVGLDVGFDKMQVEVDLSNGPHRGAIAVAWDLFGSGFTGDAIYASVSSDGGASYGTPQKINGGGSTSGIGPDVCWGPNSELYVMWADRGVFDVFVDRSFDGGVTFGADVKVTDYTMVPSPLPGSPFRMFDIFAIHADQTSGPHSGNVYVAYHHSTGGGQGRADVRVATSTDNGATWSAGIKVTTDNGPNDQVMPGICVDSNGNVNVAYYDQRNDPGDKLIWTWLSRSSDGGATWTDHQVSDVGWNPGPTEFGGTFIGDYIDTDCSDQLIHPFWCDGRSGTQDVYTDDVNLNLFSDTDAVSAATGGVVNFTINIGPNKGGAIYLLVAGGSGTSPGVVVNGVDIPINPDFWTDLSIVFAGSAIFPGTVGTLDSTGSAAAQMNTLGPFSASLVGTMLSFSAVTFDGSGAVDYATASTRVDLIP